MSAISAIVAMIYAVSVLVLFTVIIVVAMWIYRGHANLVAAGYEKIYTPGWAVGWFFVPFANLVSPFRAMRELWNLSHQQADSLDAPSVSILTQWWACWLIGNIATNIGARLEMVNGAAGPGLILGAIGSIVFAGAAWLLRSIIIEITTTQRSMIGIADTFA